MEKNYRIHTNVGKDTVLRVDMRQDFDFLEVLSIKLSQSDSYRLHSSNYGVIVGRVLANDAFGIPNAKVSVFIESDGNDARDVEYIYPYSEVTSKDRNGIRYNILPDYNDDNCYRVVGTFPNKRLVLDDNTYLEIFDKYWRYTTVTNSSGDYMIFGLPTGSTQLHVDIDLSDIGVLSQRPYDFEYKGYNLSMFDSPTQFKESTNLDGLAQIFSQNNSVFVYPFWGDADNGIAAITRSDVQIQYKFEPTCVFMGSIVSDNDGNAIGHKCAPDINSGMNDQLIGGNGTIEMIRKTTDGLVEEYQIQGNQLIDENGVWCYQIPMNLDFIGMDEYGNIVPTDNPNVGIPTRTQVRFRISKNESGDEGISRHTAKYLVPMNPIFDENEVRPRIKLDSDFTGQDVEQMYSFGSSTPDSCFRDLYWNNVYSVKNYIPKTQVAHRPYSKNYGALKGSNLATDQNEIPYNKLRVDLPFVYMIICILFTIVTIIITIVNGLLSFLHYIVYEFCLPRLPIIGKICPFRPLGWLLGDLTCISLSAGLNEGNTAFYPGCSKGAMEDSSCPDDMEGDCEKSNDNKELLDRIQRNLALEFKIIKLDLYQDWINGCLYMPLWYWRKRKKKTFLFFTLRRAKNEFCSCNSLYSRLKTYVTCNFVYRNTNMEPIVDFDEKRWHKNRAEQVRYYRGLIKPVENKDGLTAYYYTSVEATTDNGDDNELEMSQRTRSFYAVRLYATDIILLGNLNEDNIYGIPQFFKCLPSTTANIPPIATIEENVNPNEKSESVNSEASTDSEDSGTTITTGIDWGSRGHTETPAYKTGLFIDLGCTYAATKAKSCINVERISELGVSLDMTYNMAYHEGGDDVKYGKLDSDGFISKYELDDLENRAMFATLNHVGFIPQTWQDKYDLYDTQVYDTNTNYLVPKFKYLYPVDFDGRMQEIMEDYRGGFEQALGDVQDQAYLTFKLGAENAYGGATHPHRIRHFYKENPLQMPLYNNSYYFYFGIKKGSTAIDKFNKMFFSECFQNSKKPFTLTIKTQGVSYCPSAYKTGTTTVTVNCENGLTPNEEISGNIPYRYYNNTMSNAYGYIRVTSDDIRLPYSYKLYDALGNIVVEESDMDRDDFVIGGIIVDGVVHTNEFGAIRYQNCPYDCVVDSGFSLSNQIYTLEVTDADGKKVSEKVELSMSKVKGGYEAVRLSAKFYNSATTRIDYICDDKNDFYGMIKITGFTVDNHKCVITASTDAAYSGENCCIGATRDKNGNIKSYEMVDDVYWVCLTGRSDEISENVVVKLTIKAIQNKNNEAQTKNCLCNIGNDIAMAQRATAQTMKIADANRNNVYYGFNSATHVATFFIYQPNDYLMTIVQGCKTCADNDLLGHNQGNEIVRVENGENFIVSLNTMPFRFIIGTDNDNKDALVGNTSKFYNSSIIKTEKDSHICGWYGVHQEDSYQFGLSTNTTEKKNQELWEDVLNNITDSIEKPDMKGTALVFKFNAMFNLSDAVYVTTTSQSRFKITAKGGVSPILYRAAAPDYKQKRNSSATKISNIYKLTDDWEVIYDNTIPNIVTDNFKDIDGIGPHFNETSYEKEKYVGNYFAAFTKNGGYYSKREIDCNTSIMKAPSFADVSPNGGIKAIGRDEKGTIDTELTGTFRWVHTKQTNNVTCAKYSNNVSLPYLRAINVDRRLDYDLLIFAPTAGSNMNLHVPNELYNKNRIWKGGRISGTTFNGIDMSYDADYNIISADCVYNSDGSFKEANENDKLEYSYKIHEGSENAITIYNTGRTSIWGSWNTNKNIDGDDFGYESSVDKDGMLIKEFYEAYVNNLNIRHYFWSTFNRERLRYYADTARLNQQRDTIKTMSISNMKNPCYVFSYPYNKQSYYNTDFNRESVVNNNNYPTKRFIDVADLPQTSYYDIGLIGCSYSMKAYKDTDKSIHAVTKQGEKVEISLDFGRPITFVKPNAASSDYCNVEYKKEGSSDKFTAKEASLYFKINPYTLDEFTVYTSRPKVIQVLPNIEGTEIDGIGFLKTINEGNEFGGKFGDGYNLDTAIEKIILHEFSASTGNIFNLIFNNGRIDTITPLGVSENGRLTLKNGETAPEYFYVKDGEILETDNDDFTNIQFSKTFKIEKNDKHPDIKALCVLINRELLYDNNDNLSRRVRVLEASDVIDVRDVFFDVYQGHSYVEMTKLNEQSQSESQNISVPSGGGSYNPDTGQVSVDVHNESVTFQDSDTTKVFNQTMTFKLRIDDNMLNISERSNEAFADYNMMNYTFKFTTQAGEVFEVNPSEISADTANKLIIFTLKWATNMGIMLDAQWGGNSMTEPFKCEVYASSNSNFIYKLTGFKIRANSVGYSDVQHFKDAFSETGDKKTTEFELIVSN